MSRFRIVLSIALGAALPLACSKEYTPTQEITDVRESNEEESKAPEMSTQDRMRMEPVQRPGASPEAGAPAAAPAAAATYLWNVPGGWE